MKIPRLIITLAALLLPFTATADTVASGSLEQDSFFTKLEGDWQIESVGDETRIVFAENFSAKKAPDLKVFLSRRDFGDINGRNAADSEAVLIAPLSSFEGQMSFVVPDGVDLNDFASLIVHCEAYSKLWGGSALR